MNKNYVKLLVYLVASIVVGTIFMLLVYAIPTELMYSNLRESAELFNVEGMHRHLIHGYYYTDLDNSTDSIMLNIATYTGNESPMHLAMANPRLIYSEKDNVQALVQILDNREDAQVVNYARYWHGYLVFLKPLLLIFSYQEIRMLNMVVQFFLLIWVMTMLSDKVGKRYMIAFGVAVLVLNPCAIALSLQYSDIFYISLVTMLILLLKNEWFKENSERYYSLFMFSGIVTAFLDFLTYPLVALGFLLITYLQMNADRVKRQMIKIIMFTGTWFCGYFGMWAGKWFVASVFTDDNVVEDAFNNIVFRMSGDVWGESVTALDVIKVNIAVLINKPIFVICILGLLVLIIAIVSQKIYFQMNVDLLVPLLFVCIYPIGWYCIVKNHSLNHFPYAYRNMAIMVYSGLCILGGCMKYCKEKNIFMN